MPRPFRYRVISHAEWLKAKKAGTPIMPGTKIVRAPEQAFLKARQASHVLDSINIESRLMDSLIKRLGLEQQRLSAWDFHGFEKHEALIKRLSAASKALERKGMKEKFKADAFNQVNKALSSLVNDKPHAAGKMLSLAINSLKDRRRELLARQPEFLGAEQAGHELLLDVTRQKLSDLAGDAVKRKSFVLSELLAVKSKLKQWLGRQPSRQRLAGIVSYLSLLYQGLNGIPDGRQIQIQLVPAGKSLAAGKIKESIKLMNSLKL